jgi:cytoskeletal protein CcmA (bactofilin family)
MNFPNGIASFARNSGRIHYMAWFDRNPGAKKGQQAEPENIPAAPKPASEPVSMATVVSPKPEPKVEVQPPPSTAGLVGYLYKGSRISGQLSFQGPARIDGAVDGEIQCQGTLTIGESAEVRAKISGQVVVIRGKVDGNVTAKERVELAAPARLLGNIDSPRLVITEGVVFDGDCSMGVAKQKGGGVSPANVSAEKASVTQAPKLQADSKN